MKRVSFLLRSKRRDVMQIDGIFTTAGSSAVTGADNTGGGVTARSTTGKITVTLPYFVETVFSYSAQIKIATPDGTYALVDSVTANSSGNCVMTIGTYNSSHAAADTTGVVTWNLVVRE